MGHIMDLFRDCPRTPTDIGCLPRSRLQPSRNINNSRKHLGIPYLYEPHGIASARTSVATAILLSELTARPLVPAWWQRTGRFSNKLAESPSHSFHYQIASDDCWDAQVEGGPGGCNIGPLPS